MEFLKLEDWMPPAHCLPLPWLRHLLAYCGTYIGVLYLIFSYYIFNQLKASFSYILGPSFANNLGYVFLFCGVLHAMHGFVYENQYFKLGIALCYPFLVYYQTKLVLKSKVTFSLVAGLKTKADFDNIVNENKGLKKELHELQRTVSIAYIEKDLNKLKKTVENGF